MWVCNKEMFFLNIIELNKIKVNLFLGNNCTFIMMYGSVNLFISFYFVVVYTQSGVEQFSDSGQHFFLSET